MNETNYDKYFDNLHKAKNFLLVMLIAAGFLGVLHFMFAGLKEGGVYWFNLDKERNLPTWFSGMLFFLFGCSALVAYYFERNYNSQEWGFFRLPVLWLGVSLIGFALSLDEMTILHENLFWKEIRTVSSQMGDSVKYITQWQLLFAPAILIVLVYFLLFFSNRFGSSKGALIASFVGIGMWILSQSLEGIRQVFINSGPELYSLQVLIEELLEMFGTIFLIYSVVIYVIDIVYDLSAERKEKLSRASKFLTKKSALALGTLFILLILAGGVIYKFAKIQKEENAPVPKLFEKAINK